jgi:hypothetical protein
MHIVVDLVGLVVVGKNTALVAVARVLALKTCLICQKLQV